ncbi:MAG: hypothetical protein JW878_02510 [Methanomicrobia archaeon]|nr:hypothetical protein [Methanomicrobia archaeon]
MLILVGTNVREMELGHYILLLLLGALLLFTTASVSAQPPEPFVIAGYVTYENGSPCNNPQVNITNLNTSDTWQAEANQSSNYYQLVLANGTDVNATEQVRFQASGAGNEQSRQIVYTVTSDDIARGGLFPYNLSLVEPYRQTWYFTANEASSPPLSTLATYNRTMTKGVEDGDTTVTLAPGECVWFYTDEVANCTVTFPAGIWDVSYWVKALALNESSTLYTRLQSLTPDGANTTITENASLISYTEGALHEIDLAFATAGFSVPEGGLLALALCWPASAQGNLEIHCNPPGQHASSVTSPSSDPGFPVPELLSVLLLGLGLLVLLGLCGLRGKRRHG